MTTVGSNTVSVCQCSSYEPPWSADAAASGRSAGKMWEWEELLLLLTSTTWKLFETKCPPYSWSWVKESWQIKFTKDKLLRYPYAWQGQWMWFSVTMTYQNSLIMTDISCCDFDTSQCYSHFDGACLPDGQRWQENSDNGEVEGEALKRPRRGLSPLGKAIMTLLSLSMSIALQCPSISITSRLPANDRKCW